MHAGIEEKRAADANATLVQDARDEHLQTLAAQFSDADLGRIVELRVRTLEKAWAQLRGKLPETPSDVEWAWLRTTWPRLGMEALASPIVTALEETDWLGMFHECKEAF